MKKAEPNNPDPNDRDSIERQDKQWKDLRYDLNGGRITLEQAKRNVESISMSLERPLDPTKCEALAEPWWTIEMVLAWIIWRSPKEAARFSQAAAVDAYRWDGRFLQKWGRVTIDDVERQMQAEIAAGRLTGGLLSPRDQLRRELDRSGIQVTGVDSDGNVQKLADWQHLKFDSEGRAVRRDRPDIVYSDLWFDADKVRENWPPEIRHTRAAQDRERQECRIWLDDLVSRLEFGPAWTNRQIWAEAHQRWPKLTVRDVYVGETSAKRSAVQAHPSSKRAWSGSGPKNRREPAKA